MGHWLRSFALLVVLDGSCGKSFSFSDSKTLLDCRFECVENRSVPKSRSEVFPRAAFAGASGSASSSAPLTFSMSVVCQS